MLTMTVVLLLQTLNGGLKMELKLSPQVPANLISNLTSINNLNNNNKESPLSSYGESYQVGMHLVAISRLADPGDLVGSGFKIKVGFGFGTGFRNEVESGSGSVLNIKTFCCNIFLPKL